MENTFDLENYKGRPQAFIKHSLLKTYLKRLFMIIGQHERVIRYVDCFAGPWQEGSEDLQDTSIAISLNIMKECRDSLLKIGKEVKFKALYIEKSKSSFIKLQEFLINFMFDFILRAHTQTPFQEHMINIFGSIPNTEGMTPRQKEEHLVKMYINGLKNSLDQAGKRPRVSYVKVRDPFKDRTKYDLVYITRHPKGIVVFMEESEHLDLVQKKVRAQVQQEKRIEKTGQGELFPPAMPEAEVEGVSLEVVKNYWLNKLTVEPIMFGEEQLADMHEETGWFQSDFQLAFTELLDEGKVVNLNAKKRRPKRAVHFDKREFLMKVKL